MYSGKDNTKSVGLPHSDISGSKPILGSPKLFAEYHVFHRLLLPRHPPDALFLLDSSMRMWNPKKSHTSCGPFAFTHKTQSFYFELFVLSQHSLGIYRYTLMQILLKDLIYWLFINILVHFLFTKFNNTLNFHQGTYVVLYRPFAWSRFWWR